MVLISLFLCRTCVACLKPYARPLEFFLKSENCTKFCCYLLKIAVDARMQIIIMFMILIMSIERVRIYVGEKSFLLFYLFNRVSQV